MIEKNGSPVSLAKCITIVNDRKRLIIVILQKENEDRVENNHISHNINQIENSWEKLSIVKAKRSQTLFIYQNKSASTAISVTLKDDSSRSKKYQK